MKARFVILLVLCSMFFLAPSFSISALAQQYHRPYYTQKALDGPYIAPVFLENRTGGHLRVKLEVNGKTLVVEVREGHEVPDLKVPVGARVRLKEAKATLLGDRKSVERNAKFYKYTRQDSENGKVKQGWMFYLDRFFKP